VGGVTGGFKGVVSPPLWGPGQCPTEIFLGPYISWANLPMALCMVFAHGFGRDGFRSMVLDASTSIYMYCNIERNIMKNQASSPSFGIQGKILVYMCFMCYALALFIFCFRIRMQVISVWG